MSKRSIAGLLLGPALLAAAAAGGASTAVAGGDQSIEPGAGSSSQPKPGKTCDITDAVSFAGCAADFAEQYCDGYAIVDMDDDTGAVECE